MNSKITPLDVPSLKLDSCSIADHCRALIKLKKLSYWWYQGNNTILGNYSLPFIDENGNWWYQVKPGLCWPVDALAPIDPQLASPSLSRAYLGYQHIVPEASQANSTLVINTIFDLQNYDPSNLRSKRRNKIRNGISNCYLSLLTKYDKSTFDECRKAWDDLSRRTGWKHIAEEKGFDREWQMLIDCPGVSIIVAREIKSCQVAGFMIVKIIGDTAYSDTVAAATNMLHTKVNDALRYSFLANAKKITGVTKAYSAIKSSLEGLELFKSELGYEPYHHPANTQLVLGLRTLLKILAHKKYNRMMGIFDS